MELCEVIEKAKELGLTVKTWESGGRFSCIYATIFDNRSEWNTTVDAYQVDDDICIDFLNRKDELYYFIDNKTVYLDGETVNNLYYDKEEKRLGGKYTNLHREELTNKIAETTLKLNKVKQEIAKIINNKG